MKKDISSRMVSSHRLTYLDSLRALAALTVMGSHYIERTPLLSWVVFDYFRPGQFGVVVFFMVSGFVIPFSFKDYPGKNRRFMISRFFRLYPAYWLSVILACFAIVFFISEELEESRVLANITMVQAVLGYANLFGVYWTLFVELVFYGLCIALSLFGLLGCLKTRFWLAIALLLLALTGAAARHYYSVSAPVGILSSLSLMLFGGIWRNYQIDRNPSGKKYSMIWIAMFVTTFPIIALLAYDIDQGLQESAWNFTGSYFAALVFSVLATTVLKLESRVLAFLGTISYSVYLIHPFFLELADSKVHLQKGFNAPVFVMYCLSTLVFSSLCYFLIEKRSIRLGQHINAILDARLTNSKAAGAAKASSIEAGV
ncbi:acyltransferase family protein [Pseudomonas fluorescens]|uniref:acyltransferase family protein n=1 Tax=Pseudomonas fluorescens TaxID=294 RepID=UPI0012D39B0B|nr:acyltransferase [Pseudomonas fluorescens]